VAQASAASKLLGRGSAGGAGDFQEITLGTNLSMSGTTLNATGSSSFDPATTFELYEELTQNSISYGQIGWTGVNYFAVNTGTVASTSVTETGHPGLLRLNSHATNDNSGVLLVLGGGGGNEEFGSSFDTLVWSLDFLLKVGSNSTAITNAAIYVGLTNQRNADPNGTSAGIWVRRDSDESDTAFVFATCNASGAAGCGATGDDTNQRAATSTITPSAGNYYRFRISQDLTGPGSTRKIYFRVNNETAVTFCSSGCDETILAILDGNLIPFIGYFTRTTTGVLSGDADYLYVKIEGMTRY
jgi:hypothetical protein